MMMQRKSPMKTVYSRLEKNSGAGAARNVGLQNAKGKIIVFLDDDCLVKPDWLDRIVETFKKYPEAAAVGGAVRNPDDTPLGGPYGQINVRRGSKRLDFRLELWNAACRKT